LIDLVVTALYLPMESVLFPKYFSDHHQPAQLGWALMALGSAVWRARSATARSRNTCGDARPC